MSTKLNASELAREQFPMPDDPSPYKHAEVSILREGYIAAINSKAQPIADERDEYREALEWTPNGESKYFNTALLVMAVSALRSEGHMTLAAEVEKMRANIRAILAKYP